MLIRGFRAVLSFCSGLCPKIACLFNLLPWLNFVANHLWPCNARRHP